MTLIELLVVLALLVIIGGMVVPVFTGSFSSVRLKRAGDQVLTRWSQARARAIESGEVYQFTYTPESGTYQVGPWTPLADEAAGTSRASSSTGRTSTAASATTTTATTATAAATPDGTAGADDAAGRSVTLPSQITFQSGQIALEDTLTGERQVATTQAMGESTSTPILFFPDGTTSQASVVLANDRKQFVRLTLRALTGVGRATDILTQEELQRAQSRR